MPDTTPMPDQDALPQDQTADDQPAATLPTDDAEKNKKIAKAVKDGLEPAKRVRKSMYNEWKRSVELRLGHVASLFTGGIDVEDEIQTELNPDWSLVNMKVASLFSQVPNVQGAHENAQYQGAVGPFIKSLNYELSEKRSDIGTSVTEVLNDVVNASGVGAILVGYTARFDTVMQAVEPQIMLPGMPTPVSTSELNDEQLQKLAKIGLVHLEPQNRTVSDLFYADRISPTDLLWPSEFARSNFDKGNWVGYEGQAMWADAVHDFKLEESDKDKLVMQGRTKDTEDLRSQPDKSGALTANYVKYTRLFYWRARYDEDEKYLNRVWELVYVDGKDEPVVHKAWEGQRVDDKTKKLIGCQRFPLRFLTLNYVSDNPVPPSDTSAGRPQVNDLRRSRSQMFQQRERSIPLRWYDSNRINHTIAATLQRGTVQGFIPTNGDGARAMGELARASYPTEDFTFDQIAKADLLESYGMDAAQMGSPEGRKTAAQAQSQAQGRTTRNTRERTLVAKWFLGIVESMAGLMALYGEFPNLTDQERQQMQQVWDSKHIISEIAFKIRPNSTIVIDPQARAQQLTNYLNMLVKSGYVNPKPIITELTELHDLDPNEIVIDPQPKPPEEPSISWRLTGGKDLQNPVIAALMMKHKQFPAPEELQAAKKALHEAQQEYRPENDQPPPGAGGPPSPGAQPPASGAGRPISGAPHGEAHSTWKLGDRVAKRSRDVSGG